MVKTIAGFKKVSPAVLGLLLCFGSSLTAIAQPVAHLTISEAYLLARNNYPLIKQRDLIAKTRDYTVSNAEKGHLPVFSLNGQATYQSTVTSFPFKISVPGFVVPTYSKDQYRVVAEADQMVYDGGIIKNEKQMADANSKVQQQNLQVELYALYDRVNQLFFGAVLMDEEIAENELLQKDIQNGIDKATALVANGVAYRSSVDELKAQLLQAQQGRVELTAAKEGFLKMLGLFVNMKLDDSTVLEKPASPVLTDQISRPELALFDVQKQIYDLQDNLLSDELRPRLSLFLQGGYGRPGLNMLSNNFDWFYIGGVRLNWNFGSLYTLKNQQNLIETGKSGLDVQKETFLFNTKMAQSQQQSNVQKYLALIKKDDAIIQLRASVKTAASAQLENGVLSAHDYINEVNAEDQARQNKIIHEVELLQAQYQYQNTMGDIH